MLTDEDQIKLKYTTDCTNNSNKLKNKLTDNQQNKIKQKQKLTSNAQFRCHSK